MATINRICGFETGDETELIAGSAGTVSTADPRSGTYGLGLSGNTANIDPFGAQVADAGNDYITAVGVEFFDTTPASPVDFLVCNDGTNAHVRLRLATDGDLEIIDANNSIIRTVTTPFTDNVYAFLELRWARSNSTTVELFIDGDTQGTDTADTFNGTNEFTQVDFTAGAATISFDDFYQLSGVTASSDRLSNGAADPFFEVFGYQSDKASATPDDGGANLQVGQWVDCGVVPFATGTVAEYTSSNAGAVDSDDTNGNPEGPLNDSRITGTIACIQGVWLMDRSGGGGSNHFGLLGNNVDGTTQSADLDPPASPPTGFFFLSESASIVPETTEYCRIGFETSGAQDFECYGQMAMLAHIPAAGADHTGTGGTTAPAQTADGDGDNINNGTGTPANPAQTASGSGLVTYSGTGTPANAAQEADGTATVTYSGTGGTTSPAQLASGSGITNANMGSGGTTSPAQIASGAAKVTYSGSGTPSNPAQLATGAAKVTYSGTGGTTSPAQTASGAGDNVNNGTGAPENPAQTASGSGDNINNGTGGTTSPVQEASGSGDITYSGTGGTVSPAQTASGSGTSGANVGTGTPENPAQVSSGSGTVTQFIPAGEETFLEDGTFTPEAGVTEVSVLCHGGGGGGSANDAAGGGGLAWKNNISVTPLVGHSVIVGAAGVGGGVDAGTDGGDSTFEGVTGGGGGRGSTTGVGGAPSGTGGAPSGEDGGGSGGDGLRHGGTQNSGGAGAGGYTGDGGDGVLTSAGLPGSGGGSGSGGSTDQLGSGGGGTGIFGAGSNGPAGSSAPTGGGGGSDGEDGTTGTPEIGGVGGDFGGGGGTGRNSVRDGGDGGAGVVRIIWGTGRSFPNNAGPLISGTGGTVSPAQIASGSGLVTYSGSGGTTAPAQRATNLQHIIGTGGTTAPAQTAQGNDSPRSFAFSTTIMDTIAENSTVMDSSETLIAESSTVMDKIAGTSTIMAKV